MIRPTLLLAALAAAVSAAAAPDAPVKPASSEEKTLRETASKAPGPAKPVRVSLLTAPSKLTLRLGEGKQLEARVKGRTGTIRWAVQTEGCGRISPNGYFNAPARCTTPATARVIATLAEDPSLRAETVVFIEPVSVEVKPRAINLSTAQTFQFHVGVDGADDRRVRWSLEGGKEAGDISDTGLFTSPARFLTPGTLTVRATSVADPTKSATATIRLNAINVDVSPKEVALRHGKTTRFEAKVTGTPHTAVEWKVLGEDQGEISSTGLYTPPASIATPAVITIVASSEADPTKTATCRVRMEAVQIVAGSGGKPTARGKQKGGFGHTAGMVMRTVVRRVTSIYLPFNPVDAIVRGPFFRGKSGKQYVPLGAVAVLGARVVNTTNDRVEWNIEGPEVGEIGPDGVYQAPSSLTTPAIVQIRATAVADPTKSVIQTLHIPPVVVDPDREQVRCRLDAAVQLKARVRNAENDRVLWSVEGGERFGSVTETGIYRPPPVLSTPASIRVRATSAADPTKSATIEVSIPEIGLDISPGEAIVKPGGTIRLKARLKNCESSCELTWKVTPEVGSISPDGVYRAPDSGGPQLVQVSATLKADPTKTAVAQIRVR